MTWVPLGGKRRGPKPTDRVKRGVKRSPLCEGAGIPIAVVAAEGNRVDFKLARATIESIAVLRPRLTRRQPQGLSMDKDYDFNEVRELAAEFGDIAHICSRGEMVSWFKRTHRVKARR